MVESENEPQESVDEYWHFRWTAFVIACLVCVALFGVLVLVRHVAPVEMAASLGDYLVLACGFFMSIVGVKGETWNGAGTTWLKRLTWAGRMILLGLLFTLSVTLYQKLEIDGVRNAEQARREAEQAKGRKERLKQLQDQLKQVQDQLDTKTQQLNAAVTQAASTITGSIESETKYLKENATKSGATLQKIEKGIEGCPADVQSQLRPKLTELGVAIARGSEGNAATLEQLKSMGAQLTSLTLAQSELVATQDKLRARLAEQKVSERLLLRKWVGHWAHGNWFTEGSFEKTDDARLVFNATTTFEAIARKGGAAQSVKLMQWQGDPFTCDGTSDGIAFPVKRKILPSAEAMDDRLKAQSLASTMRMRLGLALIGNYGGNGENAHLVMYEALD